MKKRIPIVLSVLLFCSTAIIAQTVNFNKVIYAENEKINPGENSIVDPDSKAEWLWNFKRRPWKTPVTIEMRNESLIVLFQQIEKQLRHVRSYKFVYVPNRVEAHRVYIQKCTVTIEDALNASLKGTDLKYRFVGNSIVVYSGEQYRFN